MLKNIFQFREIKIKYFDKTFLWEDDKIKKALNYNLKFCDGDGPNLCRVKKVDVSSTLLKIYFGLGWPSSVLEIVSSQRLKTNSNWITMDYLTQHCLKSFTS